MGVSSPAAVVDLGKGRQKGPEYETVVDSVPTCDHRSGAVTRLGDLCDRFGMDIISASGTIGFALTLFERGIISEMDTDGLTLKWGDEEVVAN